MCPARSNAGRRDRSGTTNCCNGIRNGISRSSQKAIGITAIRLFNRISCFTRCIRCSHGAWRRLAASRLRMLCCWYRIVAGLFAIVVLFKLVSEEFGDQLALATTALLSFFPASVLLSAGYTEPLAVFLIVSFFLALKRKYYLSAALLAGLVISSRSTGIVLLPVLLWEMWLNRDQRPFLPALLPCILLATSGIWLFMIYLWNSFGTPFAFSDGQVAFHQGTTLATRLVAALKFEPFTRMILNDWNPWGQASWFTLLFVVLIVVGWSRLPSTWTLFAMGVLLLPYLTLSGGPAGFVSMSRFNLLSFPLFVVLADLGLRARWLLAGVIGLFGASLFMNTTLFARRIWIG